MQPYLNKVPAALVRQLPPLAEATRAVAQSAPLTGDPAQISDRAGLGSAYRLAAISPLPATRDPFTVDPAVVERGLRGHAETQNAAAASLSLAGLVPRSPRSDEPNFDLAWDDAEFIYVAEVKSITTLNEERQLRLGLGQVIRYRQLLRRKHQRETRAVLIAEREPRDASWHELCADLGFI